MTMSRLSRLPIAGRLASQMRARGLSGVALPAVAAPLRRPRRPALSPATA